MSMFRSLTLNWYELISRALSGLLLRIELSVGQFSSFDCSNCFDEEMAGDGAGESDDAIGLLN